MSAGLIWTLGGVTRTRHKQVCDAAVCLCIFLQKTIRSSTILNQFLWTAESILSLILAAAMWCHLCVLLTVRLKWITRSIMGFVAQCIYIYIYVYNQIMPKTEKYLSLLLSGNFQILKHSFNCLQCVSVEDIIIQVEIDIESWIYDIKSWNYHMESHNYDGEVIISTF